VGDIVRNAATAEWYQCTGNNLSTVWATDKPLYWTTQVYPMDIEVAANPTYWVQTIWWNGNMTSPMNTFTWANAIVNCEALSYAGYTDWHLANIEETYSCVDKAYASTPRHPRWFMFPVDSWCHTSTTDPSTTTSQLAPYMSGNGNIRSDSKANSYGFFIVRKWRDY
jgi:hypothetical protein